MSMPEVKQLFKKVCIDTYIDLYRKKSATALLTVLSVLARFSLSAPAVDTLENCSQNPQSLWWVIPCQKCQPGKTT